MISGAASVSFDAIVVGGGLVGAALALGMRREGLTVALLDESDVAFRASRGNFGLVWVQNKGVGKPAYARWTRLSSNLWKDFAEELGEETGIDLQFSRPGGFHFCLTGKEFSERRIVMERLTATSDPDFTYEMMDHAALKRILPLIGDSVVGASFSPWDGHANSLRLFHALHRAFAIRGGRYFSGRKVTDIRYEHGVFDVTTANGHFQSARIVLAAGNGTRALAPLVGLNAPVGPTRGQILVTTKLRPFLNHPTALLRQTGEGSALIGESKEETGFDDRSSPEIIRELAARAVATFPILKQAMIVRTWGALRVMTPDGFPVYQQSETCPGAFVACLHSGVTLAAVHAQILGKKMAEGQLPEGFESFRAERFDVQQAA